MVRGQKRNEGRAKAIRNSFLLSQHQLLPPARRVEPRRIHAKDGQGGKREAGEEIGGSSGEGEGGREGRGGGEMKWKGEEEGGSWDGGRGRKRI
eukprot:748860-Hanusia_phi.AAC.1